jgi:two-component system sensor histidine kinase VicK
LPAKLPTLHADRDKLAVVLNNLLGNAIKYTPEKGEVHVGCKITERSAVITVKDSGIGIDEQEHERIFERFQRSADPAVLAEAGTGIGLTTAREILQHHNGSIEVISRKGEGATFVVRLPCDASLVAGVGEGT